MDISFLQLPSHIYYILCTVYVLCTVLYCSVLYSVLYTTEGENLHGLHEKDSGLGEMIL